MTRPARPFVRFLIVGTGGFAVDASLLWILISLGGDAYLSRCFSFAMGMSFTWALNRRWTFHAKRKSALYREYASYALIQGAGVAINFTIYAFVLSKVGTSPAAAVLALACGSAVALIFNFLGLKHLVFRSTKS